MKDLSLTNNDEISLKSPYHIVNNTAYNMLDLEKK